MSEPTPTPADHAHGATEPRRPGLIERLLRVAAPPLHRRWLRLERRNQHWIAAIVLGVLIELVLHLGGHVWHWSLLAAAQNSALDAMMRLDAVLRAAPEPGLPRFALVDVDDETWRSAAWGGGEPVQAPRDALLGLVRQAFAAGSRQVVLDVIVEDAAIHGIDGPLARALREEDRRFADGLHALLDDPAFDAGRQLILVRSLRAPLARTSGAGPAGGGAATGPGATGRPGNPLPTLRRSEAVDAVVAASGGRITLAAPYFHYSPDRVLRDWLLFQIVCQPGHDASGSGRLRVVASVQLAASARHFGVAPAAVTGDALPATACAAEIGSGGGAGTTPAVGAFSEAYWEGLRRAYTASPACARTPRCRDATLPPLARLDALANRILFRVGEESRAGAGALPLVTRLPAADLLADDARGGPSAARRALLSDRVTVIGQSHGEARDRHLTPLGEMPGALVLINAIDSMSRHQVLTAPSAVTTWTIAMVLIVAVAWLFVRWDTIVAAYLGAIVVVLSAGVGSYLWFAHGVWLDFALPLVGVQVHRLTQMWEERIARWRRAGQLGAPAEH